ncbi:MAG: hypothetical protein AVDCRST_MAG26-1570, partial [uncultured Chloroflexia bacterium]
CGCACGWHWCARTVCRSAYSSAPMHAAIAWVCAPGNGRRPRQH